MVERGTPTRRSPRWFVAIAVLTSFVLGLSSGCSSDASFDANDARATTTGDRTTSTSTARSIDTTTTEPPAATTTSPAAPTSSSIPNAPTGAVDLPLPLPDVAATALVDRLVVATPDPNAPHYVRDQFDGGGWAYDYRTKCNTRERVLIEESLIQPTVDDKCRTTDGRWRSAYDGIETDDPADLQIDHLVPLADAWRSGAWRWDGDQRLAFANDLTSPDTLIAVSGASNQSKGDRSPDLWMPPSRDDWCDYASAWVRVKTRWALRVTPAEKSTLVSVLSGC